MQILITPSGDLRCVYGEAIDLSKFGQVTICRGSQVEPDHQGQWLADLAPVILPAEMPLNVNL